jgi:hypothetical protein
MHQNNKHADRLKVAKKVKALKIVKKKTLDQSYLDFYQLIAGVPSVIHFH